MKKTTLKITIICIFFMYGGMSVYAYSLQQMNTVLNPANDLFVAMQNRKYSKIWSLLTVNSKKNIIDSICIIMSKKFHEKCNKKKLYASFKNGQKTAVDYWNAYIKHFNPKTILKESQWNIKYIKENSAVISIKYKKAPTPFFLEMKKEKNSWKVGLIESVLSHY